jgi:hypothetical protein
VDRDSSKHWARAADGTRKGKIDVKESLDSLAKSKAGGYPSKAASFQGKFQKMKVKGAAAFEGVRWNAMTRFRTLFGFRPS